MKVPSKFVKIGTFGSVGALLLLTSCSAKPTPEITQACEAYLFGIQQTLAGTYPNTPAGNKLFLQQMQSIKDYADTSLVPELKESADAMYQAVQDQNQPVFASAGQRFFDTCKKYGFQGLS